MQLGELGHISASLMPQCQGWFPRVYLLLRRSEKMRLQRGDGRELCISRRVSSLRLTSTQSWTFSRPGDRRQPKSRHQELVHSIVSEPVRGSEAHKGCSSASCCPSPAHASAGAAARFNAPRSRPEDRQRHGAVPSMQVYGSNKIVVCNQTLCTATC